MQQNSQHGRRAFKQQDKQGGTFAMFYRLYTDPATLSAAQCPHCERESNPSNNKKRPSIM
jgi:hypothetical protein